MSETIKVKIKRILADFPLPEYESEGAVGFDFHSIYTTYLSPGEIKLIPTDVIIEVPEGYMLMVVARSSTARKKGVMLPNGVGIIDNDYCGEDDQIFVQVFNFTQEEQLIESRSKIAQGVLVKVAHADFVEVDSMAQESRGGFGSTDKPTERDEKPRWGSPQRFG